MNPSSLGVVLDGDLADAEALGRAVAPDAVRHRVFREVRALFASLDPASDLRSRVEQLERVTRWIASRRSVPALPDASPADLPQVSRLRLLTALLERFPSYTSRLSELVASILNDTSGLYLFGRLGLPGDRGFLGETIDRLSRRFLPEPVDEQSLTELTARLFPSPRDLVWLASLPELLLARFAALLEAARPDGGCFAPLGAAIRDAIALIATRVSAVGLSEVIRARSPICPLQSSPFFHLPRACDRLIALSHAKPADPAEERREADGCRALSEDCREVVASVVRNLEERGVSIDVVYRLELITKNLERLDALVDRLQGRSDPASAARARDLLVRLNQARQRDRNLVEILRNNLHLMARKVIERAGHTGEHYITTTRGEYVKMLFSAGGGGVLTVGTTAMKYLTVWAHFAPFVEGMLLATNYAGSFLVMQMLGFTLATKQPSMTAAALAGSLRETSGHPDLSGLVTTIARITRSQLAAAIGNIGMVIPAAVAFDLVFRTKFGRPFLDTDTATHTIESLHLTHSGAAAYAALTGVLLWLSSVGAGWLENWATYRRIPEAIAEHRIGRFLGRRTMGWLSRVFSRNISGFGGNTTLGFLLGMTPVMGKFFGLPLDIRHVTLSTGALTLALCSIGFEAIHGPDVLFAAAGIAVIGLLNFGVSFVLALAVALRAREVDRSDRFRLLASVVLTFLRSPLQFFVPTSPEAASVHGPASIRPKA
jgi:site-specific recombinase